MTTWLCMSVSSLVMIEPAGVVSAYACLVRPSLACSRFRWGMMATANLPGAACRRPTVSSCRRACMTSMCKRMGYIRRYEPSNPHKSIGVMHVCMNIYTSSCYVCQLFGGDRMMHGSMQLSFTLLVMFFFFFSLKRSYW